MTTAIDAVKANFQAYGEPGAPGHLTLVRPSTSTSSSASRGSCAKDVTNTDLLNQTLYRGADALRVIAALIEPVMPDAASRVRRMLGVGSESWTSLRVGALAPGTKLGGVEPLFPRIEKTVEELRNVTTGNESAQTLPSSHPQSAASMPAAAPGAPIPAPAAATAAATPAAAPASDGHIALATS